MVLWRGGDALVLASRSAARRAMLEGAGIPVQIHPADLDERALEAGAPSQAPDAIAAFLAREKARFVARQHPGKLVVGADQTLALNDRRFAKPSDRSAARTQLQELRGRTHALHAAVAIVRDATMLFEHVDTAQLTMRRFPDETLDLYLDTVGDAAMASVGAYQIEGPGIQLFERIDGDYFTILGLPLLAALGFLRKQGYLAV
jgi:septum formation protein